MNDIDRKSQSVISAEGLDEILAVGVDNLTYVSHIVLPFASNYPDRQAVVIRVKDGRGSIVCPFERLVQGISDPEEAYVKVKAKLCEM